jgi:hypothetical protein
MYFFRVATKVVLMIGGGLEIWHNGEWSAQTALGSAGCGKGLWRDDERADRGSYRLTSCQMSVLMLVRASTGCQDLSCVRQTSVQAAYPRILAVHQTR